MGRVKELYMEMLEKDLEYLTLEQYMQLKDLADQHAEEQYYKYIGASYAESPNYAKIVKGIAQNYK